MSGAAARMAAACLVAGACGHWALGQGMVDPPAGVESAAGRAAEYLKERIGRDGACQGEYEAGNVRHGGRTALAAYALLSAKAPAADPAVARAMGWLRRAKLTGVYAVAMRACALAALNNETDRALLTADVKWLIEAARADGSYTYGPAGKAAAGVYDNSNSQMAVLAVWEAQRRGVEVPAAYWQMVERHWLSTQQADGGWAYFSLPGGRRANSYGSMTAAGLASLFICHDNLYRDRYVRCQDKPAPEPIARGMEWLSRRFDVTQNPGKGVEWQHYWLYGLERVALASGWRHFGKHDWYAEGAAELIDSQNPDGSFSDGPPADRVEPTAFSLLFLAHGRNPVAINKLQYPGAWNARPRDAANFAAFIGENLERTAAWQVVDVQAASAGWDDAPILYISGAGPCRFTDDQIDKLRSFVFRGGLIVSESACGNAVFTLDMQAAYAKMFPAWPLARLDDAHELYTHNFKVTDMSGLLGVSNGVRLLAVHAPQELSLDLQLGPLPGRRKSFDLLGNAFILATDRGRTPDRGRRRWPATPAFVPAVIVRVARIRHEGNADPEPLAWDRLAATAGRNWRVQLAISPPMPPEDLDAARWPVAVLTGTAAFTLTPPQAVAIGAYLRAGGTLVVSPGGAGKPFLADVDRQIVPLAGPGPREPLAQLPLLAGPAPLDAVHYRSSFAMTLTPADRTRHRLEAVFADGRAVLVLSREDFLAGLLDYGGYRIPGYSPESASALMTNILTLASQKKLVAETPTTRPATQPAP